jgi:hypothetical protein
MFHHSYKIDANFYKFFSIERQKMQRYGQLSAKPPAKPPPEQNCDFIMIMLLAWSQIQSGGMLLSEGILRTGEELLHMLLHMSQESKRSLWQKYADRHANFISRQVLMLKKFRFCAFLWAKLLGKQSWQPCRMKVPPHVLRHLMTKCIPRIRIAPIIMLKEPVQLAWQLTGSFFYDPSGYIHNGRSVWSRYHHPITAITSHSTQPLVALMHSDGKVWIGKVGDRDNLFRLIHSPTKEDEKATAIAFHPSASIIAVAVEARIMVYKISPSLKPELHFTVSFYESGYFCPKPKYSADKLGWNPTGTFLTAISSGKLSMSYSLKSDTYEVIGGFNGWTKYANLRSFDQQDMSPSCSCFSGDKLVTGYTDGTLMVRTTEKTPDTRVTLACLKISDKVLPGQIGSIVAHPHNHSVFAIEVKAEWSHSSVLIVLVNHDGSVTITATIPDAKSPHFHEDWLLVSSRNKILFHHMNSCNIPCLVTEFHLQPNGTMRVDFDAFCVKPAPNGKVMLYYAHDGKSSLCTAEIALS